MSILVWLFISIFLVGYFTTLFVCLLKILQKHLKIHAFYINICNFCTMLVAGLAFVMLILANNNGMITFWTIFAVILGAALCGFSVYMFNKIIKKRGKSE